MKPLRLLAALCLVVPALAFARQPPPHDPNPNHDPDVQRGYDQNQKNHQQKEHDKNETYTVHKTGEGHGGVPTSGGYDTR